MAKVKKTPKTAALDQSKQKKLPKNKESSKVVLNKTKKTTKTNKNTEVIALDKTKQKKLTKNTEKIKKDIKSGKLALKESKKELQKKAAEARGLVYIGHIPHGFYEEEMKNYFKQFGKVTNVKVCRSRITGNSKGFGYVEFAHAEVAKIAAESMNNYLMFKKRLIAEYVPFEKRPRAIFQGKSYKAGLSSTIVKRQKQILLRNKPVDEEKVEKQTKLRLTKLQKKIKKLDKVGIKCNLKPVAK